MIRRLIQKKPVTSSTAASAAAGVSAALAMAIGAGSAAAAATPDDTGSALNPQLPGPSKALLRSDEKERIKRHLQLHTAGKVAPLALPYGELPLSAKARPLCELPTGPERDAIPLATLRGRIDVAPVLEMLRQLPAEIWQPEGQGTNVQLERAGHDRWGIGKVVLIMCDDFTTQVFHFPWLQAWRPVLTPILEHLGVPERRVIRCLLAAMPSGQHIPTHHDTGEWVPCCHRIHVPITTDDSVAFSVGYTEDAMMKLQTEPGLVFELNNASKHTVYNGWDKVRIHLILDYVDEADEASLPAPTVLAPGQKLLQTRRTIDLEGAPLRHPIPTFCIIGAQKAGTTSLYDMICHHALVVPAKRKEPHFLDWRWNPEKADESDLNALRAGWAKYFDMKQLTECPSLMTGEATPSYLLGGELVAARMAALAPNARLIVTLREPIERAYSHFRMCADTRGSAQQLANRGHEHVAGRDFASIVAEDLEALSKAGVSDNAGDVADECTQPFEDGYCQRHPGGKQPSHGAHSFVGRGLYAAQLRPWLRHFPAEQIMVVTLDQLSTPDRLEATMRRVYEFVGLPPSQQALSDCLANGPSNARPAQEPLDDQIREQMRQFYAPHNRALQAMLTQYGQSEAAAAVAGWPK